MYFFYLWLIVMDEKLWIVMFFIREEIEYVVKEKKIKI